MSPIAAFMPSMARLVIASRSLGPHLRALLSWTTAIAAAKTERSFLAPRRLGCRNLLAANRDALINEVKKCFLNFWPHAVLVFQYRCSSCFKLHSDSDLRAVAVHVYRRLRI